MSSKKKPLTLTRATEQKLYNQFLTLSLAYLWEEDCFAKRNEDGTYILDEEGNHIVDTKQIERFYNEMSGWLNSIKDHLITVNKVRDIVYNLTGTRPFN